MMALDAGKDVMCEKPTLTIAEGRALVEKVAAKKAVYQVGLEDRSTSHYHKIAQLVRNGTVGDLRRITAGLPSGPKPFQGGARAGARRPQLQDVAGARALPSLHAEPDASRVLAADPRLLRRHADRLGRAPARHRAGGQLFRGVGAGVGGREGDLRRKFLATMPTDFEVTYRYANGVELLAKSGGVMLRLEGDKGWIGNDGWLGGLKASDPGLLRIAIPPGRTRSGRVPPASTATSSTASPRAPRPPTRPRRGSG
jgi:hypothetical protein